MVMQTRNQSTYLWAFGPTLCKLAGNIPLDGVNVHHLILRPTFDIINLENNVITGFTLRSNHQPALIKLNGYIAYSHIIIDSD